MNPDTGELTIIDKVQTMDTPRGQYELLVRATDYGKCIVLDNVFSMPNILLLSNKK